MDKITEVSKKALRDGNKVIEELLPEDALELYKKRLNGRIRLNRERASIPGLDSEINPHKWYPMFFDKDDTPTVLPQGWFYRTTAIKWWKYKLGEVNLSKKLFFITGKEVLAQNYTLKNYIIFNHKTVRVFGKILFPPEVRLSHSRKSFKKTLKKTLGCDGSTKETEKLFFEALFIRLPKIFKPQYDRDAIKSRKYKNNEKRIKQLNRERKASK